MSPLHWFTHVTKVSEVSRSKDSDVFFMVIPNIPLDIYPPRKVFLRLFLGWSKYLLSRWPGMSRDVMCFPVKWHPVLYDDSVSISRVCYLYVPLKPYQTKTSFKALMIIAILKPQTKKWNIFGKPKITLKEAVALWGILGWAVSLGAEELSSATKTKTWVVCKKDTNQWVVHTTQESLELRIWTPRKSWGLFTAFPFRRFLSWIFNHHLKKYQ